MRKFNVLFLLILICEILTFGGCSKTKKTEQKFSENSDLNSQTNIADLEDSNLQNNNSRLFNANSNLKPEDKKLAKRISKLEKEIKKSEKKENSIKNIKIVGTKNFSSIPLAFMMESNKSLSKKILLNYEIFSSDSELEKNLSENKIDFAVLPLNLANNFCNEFENIKILAVFQNENSKIQEDSELSDENFTMNAIIVNSDFAKENKKIVKKLLNLFKNAQTWVLKNPIKASIFAERRNLLPYEQKNIRDLIEKSNFTYKKLSDNIFENHAILEEK